VGGGDINEAYCLLLADGREAFVKHRPDVHPGKYGAEAAGLAWLIDPSAYGGHRELDLAMLRLFGEPSERIFSAYEEQSPLAAGWEDRIELYQLLPLLVHALLSGGSYISSAEGIARRYAV
jgi:fructosamine-3-kinase